MLKTVTPFLDRVGTVSAPDTQQQSFDATFGPLVTGFSGFSEPRAYNEQIEQLKEYRLWVYAAVFQIAKTMSAQRPCLGRISKAARDGNAYHQRQALNVHTMSADRESYIRQHYPHIWRVSQSGEFEITPVASHPLTELLNNVNDEDTWCELFFESVMFWMLTGHFYWLLNPTAGLLSSNGRRIPAEIWAIHPHWVKEKRDPRTGVRIGWEVTAHGNSSKKLTFGPDDIVENKFKSPLSKLHPTSPIQAGAEWVNSSRAIEKSRNESFEHGINPDVILKLDPNFYKNPKDPIVDRLVKRFQRLNRSSANKFGSLVSPPGVDIEKWSQTVKEMAYKESAGDIRDSVLAIFGMNRFVVGITEDMNRAQVEAALVHFWEITINPLLGMQSDFMTSNVATIWGDDLVVWFEDGKPHNSEQQLSEDRLDLEFGALTPDELRVARGRQPRNTPPYQTGWIGAGRVPLDEDVLPEPELDDGGDDDLDSPDDDDELEPDADDSDGEAGGDDESDD